MIRLAALALAVALAVAALTGGAVARRVRGAYEAQRECVAVCAAQHGAPKARATRLPLPDGMHVCFCSR